MPQDFEIVSKPKVTGTKNLDTVTRKSCPELDLLLCFHLYLVNVVMLDLPILSWKEFVKLDKKLISQGWLFNGDFGLIMETMRGNETVVGGTLPRRMASCLSAFDLFLRHYEPVLASMVLANKERVDLENPHK